MFILFNADNDECGSSHDCEDLCVNIEGAYECRCSEGKVLAADGRSCDGNVLRLLEFLIHIYMYMYVYVYATSMVLKI